MSDRSLQRALSLWSSDVPLREPVGMGQCHAKTASEHRALVICL